MIFPIPKTFQEFKEIYFENDKLINKASPADARYKWFTKVYKMYTKNMPKTLLDTILKRDIKKGKFKENISICKNAFPYIRLISKSKTKHFLIWQIEARSDDNFTNREFIEAIVREWLGTKGYSANHPFIIHTNNINQKSIKNIEHWHLFVAPK